jgi:hypothetical protein
VKWFASIINPHTRRAYENAVRDFAGIRRPEGFPAVACAHVYRLAR